jgi:hypothetical protein
MVFREDPMKEEIFSLTHIHTQFIIVKLIKRLTCCLNLFSLNILDEYSDREQVQEIHDIYIVINDDQLLDEQSKRLNF